MPLLALAPGFSERALPLSVKAWHAMVNEGLAPKRAELIRGAIIEKTSKSIIHIKLASRLLRLLQGLLEPAFWVRAEAPVTAPDSEPEPDLSVVPGPEDSYQDHPTTAKLIVEVSVTSLAEDREMARIYAEAGVEEYWIVDAKARRIEIYRDPLQGRYQTELTAGEGSIAECRSLPPVRVEVSELFDGLEAVAG